MLGSRNSPGCYWNWPSPPYREQNRPLFKNAFVLSGFLLYFLDPLIIRELNYNFVMTPSKMQQSPRGGTP